MGRGVAITAGLALLLSGTLAFVFRPSLYAPYDEGRVYAAIASRDGGQVYSYYGGRLLHPLFVRLVADLSDAPIDARLFLWVSAASLIGMFLLLGILYDLEYSSSGRLWLVLLVTTTVVDSYRNYYWHDLFYAALCALFFLILRASPWASLPIAFLLCLTRESAIVLIGAFVLVAAIERQWKLCVLLVLVGFAAMRVDSALVGRPLPNKHGISSALLNLLKLPYNFALNVCGLEFWTNTNAATLDPPIWVTRVPAWLHLGSIREVGYSGFFWDRPFRTFLVMSTAFGILPLAVVRAAAQSWRRLLPARLEMSTASSYGAAMFVLAPLVGTLPYRYVLYAWPLFWLFAVDVLHTAFPDLRTRAELVVLSLCASWVPAVVRLATGPSIRNADSVSSVTGGGLAISLVVVIVIYARGWTLLKFPGEQSG